MIVGARAGRPCLRSQSRIFGVLNSSPHFPTRSICTREPILRERLQWQHRQHAGRSRQQGTYSDAKRPNDDSHIINDQSQLHAEANARQARIRYGDALPMGLLDAEEYRIYERLFGPPVSMLSAEETLEFDEGGIAAEADTVETQHEGMSVQGESAVLIEDEFALQEEEEEEFEEDELDGEEEEEAAERLSERQKAEAEYHQMEQAQEATLPRTHPLTLEGRFNVSPAIFELPLDSMVNPTAIELGRLSNKHLTEAADRIFGGRFLPDSVATPQMQHMQQAPPRLTATQSSMSPIEAGLFIAANIPGMYGCISSALVETRKRLGSAWLNRLFDRTGGPRILDVGSAGAGVQAWREILRAEWERLHPKAAADKEVPHGKSTVVVGSHELRERISFLSDTTFLPRLPDFNRKRDLPGWDNFEPGARKHFDVIIASHTLWTLGEEFERRDFVQNLWSLLDPNGGVLILIEKGVPRGFELIAGARELLLHHHIASPESTETEHVFADAPGNRHTQKEEGMIVAPCTNHGQCPMYTVPGEMQARKDWCRFATRFTRPPYLKRLVGSRSRDHERIRFSYVSVQRGVDLRKTQGIVQNEAATLAALAGFENAVPMTASFTEGAPSEQPAPSEAHSAQPSPSEALHASQTSNAGATGTTSPSAAPSMLALPRLILPALKRKGHVTFDVCTPSARIERWTMPKSKSRQGYRDARKSRWGDLWALGAKTRVIRTPRTGVPKKAKPHTPSRPARKEQGMAQEVDVFAEEKDRDGDWVDVEGAIPGRGRTRRAGKKKKSPKEEARSV